MPLCVVPAGQTQVPPVQVCPVPHALPQVPQLAGSVAKVTHAVPHMAGQVQTPAPHESGDAQRVPQVPQLFWLVCRLVQVPPQLV